MTPTFHPNQSPGIEGLHSQCLHIKLTLELGVGGEHDLKTAIENETVYMIGANSTTDAVGSFKYLHITTSSGEMSCGTQSGEASTDNGNIAGVRQCSHRKISTVMMQRKNQAGRFNNDRRADSKSL
jgi:hypothetical protein